MYDYIIKTLFAFQIRCAIWLLKWYHIHSVNSKIIYAKINYQKVEWKETFLYLDDIIVFRTNNMQSFQMVWGSNKLDSRFRWRHVKFVISCRYLTRRSEPGWPECAMLAPLVGWRSGLLRLALINKTVSFYDLPLKLPGFACLRLWYFYDCCWTSLLNQKYLLNLFQ